MVASHWDRVSLAMVLVRGGVGLGGLLLIDYFVGLPVILAYYLLSEPVVKGFLSLWFLAGIVDHGDQRTTEGHKNILGHWA